MQITPATSLDDVYKTLSPEPLLSEAELAAFYAPSVNEVRGGDRMALLELGLRRAHGGTFYKTFLVGHPGVGKSTELTRLIQRVEGRFRAIRFSATGDLDPAAFQPFDVLLLMMAEIAERTGRSVTGEGLDLPLSDALLRRVWDWFATETDTHKQAQEIAAQIAAGAGIQGDSWWAKALGLFASVKGEAKYASVRTKETTQRRLNRLSSLIDLANSLLDECNRLLGEADGGREWLFIGEDFDKPGIPAAQTEDLFLTYANLFKDLRAHLVFNIPIGLLYSQKKSQLPFPAPCIPDTPVFHPHPDHRPHAEGRQALRNVLDCRMNAALFDRGQRDRLIVASGGNLRDLFRLVGQAADNALLRGASVLSAADADKAINELRTEYSRSLGESVFDEEKVTYAQKADLMVRIYGREPAADIPDAVLHSLLRARAVQEFNGERWFGIHPLVVDILAAQSRLKPDAKGVVPGGTRHPA